MANIFFEQNRDIQTVIQSISDALGKVIELADDLEVNKHYLMKLAGAREAYEFVIELFGEDYPDPFVEKHASRLKGDANEQDDRMDHDNGSE